MRCEDSGMAMGGKRGRSGFVGWLAEFVKRFVAFVEFAFLRDAEFAKFLP